MKASLAMIVATAIVATASPLNKRKYVTEYETETTTFYVYPDGSPVPTTVAVADHYKGNHKHPTVTTTSVVSASSSVYVAPTTYVDAADFYVTTVIYEPSQDPTSTSVYVVPTSYVDAADFYVTTVIYEPSQEPTSTSVYVVPTTYVDAAKTTSSVVKTYSSVATSTSSGSSVSDKTLSSHNEHRSNHSASALEWDDDLATYALTSAKNCVFEHDLTPGGGGYGQNIAMYGSSTKMPDAGTAIEQAVTNMWYNGELELYPGYGYEPDMTNFEEWGHFTQVVWKDTEKVGCASYKCAAGTLSSMESWFTVCNYSPAGNYGGEYSANVKAPSGMTTTLIDV